MATTPHCKNMAHNSSIFQFALDANEANVPDRVGSNVYAFHILKSIEAVPRRRTNFKFKVLLSSPPMADLPAPRDGWEYIVFGPQRFWTQWALPIYLWKNRNELDAFYTPSHYAPRISSVPYISSVMDVSFLDYPDQFKETDLLQLKDWTEYSAKHAAKIITISQATRLAVARSYQRALSDILVAYPAVDRWPLARRPNNPEQPDFIGSNLKKWLREKSITSPYFLYLGTLQPRKNIPALIAGFEQFYRSEAGNLVKPARHSKGISGLKQTARSSFTGTIKSRLPHLVIAGKIGWLAKDILAKVENSPLKSCVHLPGFVPEDIKPQLMRQSSAVILLGEGEGFGIPPLEAMNLGVPAIVANSASLPEVVGSAGWLVDPKNTAQVAQALSDVWNLTPASRQAWWVSAKNQVKKFGWKKSALVVLNALEEMAIHQAWK